MTDQVKLNDVGDILYVHLREGEIAKTRAFGDDRLVDVDANGVVLGVEFIGIDGELDLRGLPEQEAIQDAIVSSGVGNMNVMSDSAAA